MKKKLDVKSFFSDNSALIFTCLCAACVLFILHTFTGQWMWKSQPYNSYILQAQSWLEGRLDLGQDYPYLELAIFNGKYFVSFPPFPSYLMLPFVAMGWDSCDSVIAYAASITAVVYAYKIFRHFGADEKSSAFFALFLTVGSNWLMTAQNAWVWFIAQNLSFTFCLMAVYYALKNKAGLSLMFWSFAVGCRPLQVLYIPVLLYVLYMAHMSENPDDKLSDIIKKRRMAVIPMAVVALSYMILNFARFGNIAEFGHNYLPEFTRVEDGQFSVNYIKSNIVSLMRLPEIKNGVFQYPSDNGMCIFFISPIFVSYVVYTIRSLIEKDGSDKKIMIMVAVITVLELIAITAHKTMGGSHFGNRYPSDTLPFVYFAIAALSGDSKPKAFNYPLFFIGITLNVIGTAMYFAN